MGASWLKLLSEEGYDIVAYLEEERALHQPQKFFTHTFWWGCPRKLVFDVTGKRKPCVYWQRWIHPDSSALQLLTEFQEMDIFQPLHDGAPWQESWPIAYYTVWLMDAPSNGWTRYKIQEGTPDAAWARLFRSRANRRWWKKTKKRARANGTKMGKVMPGARPI